MTETAAALDAEREALRAAMRSGMTLAHWAERHPDLPAIVTAGGPGGDRTYAELNADANRLARSLRGHGLEPGDGVAAMVSNRAEFAVTYAAALRAGLRFTPGELAPHRRGGRLHRRRLRGQGVRGRRPLRRGGGRGGAGRARRRRCGWRWAARSTASPLRRRAGRRRTRPTSPTRCWAGPMLYTSGTTGRPKGVHRTDNQAVSRRTMPATRLPPGRVAAPVHRPAVPRGAAGVLAGRAAAGRAWASCSWTAGRRRETLRLIEDHRITHTHMVPTMFHRLLALPDEEREAADVSSLRYVLHGAAPCPVAIKQAMIEWFGPVLVEYYAATEGVGHLSWPARSG